MNIEYNQYLRIALFKKNGYRKRAGVARGKGASPYGHGGSKGERQGEGERVLPRAGGRGSATLGLASDITRFINECQALLSRGR